MGAAFDDQVSGIAALDHAISRRIYQLVVAQDWVSRDRAAADLELPRSVAAFHLDKLVDAGLLCARFERVSGRRGPGAGRPTKLYGRSDFEIEVSLPPHRYDLAGGMLAEAITQAHSGAVPLGDAVAMVARETGTRIGSQDRLTRSSEPGTDLMEVLARHGYEPRRLGPTIAMVNCPFHALAEKHRDLVCGMNLDFLGGVLEGLGDADAFSPRLAPESGFCCVRIEQR